MDSKQIDTADNFTTIATGDITHDNDALPFNPLIQAANLFFDATLDPDTESLGKTQRQLLDNLDTFGDIVSRYYAEGLVLVSFYILSFAIDSLMAYRLGKYGDAWKQYSLINHSFQFEDEKAIERLLDSVDFLCLSEETDAQLLEFVYVCMSFSIKNNAASSPRLATRTKNAMNKLYKIIHDSKGGFKTTLETAPPPKPSKKTDSRTLPVWVTMSVTFVVLLTIYSIMTLAFNYKSRTTLSTLNNPQTHIAENDRQQT